VSIYKRQSAFLDDLVASPRARELDERKFFPNEAARERTVGDLVITMETGQGFGNFAFSRSGKELRRTASVVSDGYRSPESPERRVGERDEERASRLARPLVEEEKHRHPPSYFLVIPNKVYVMDISKNADGALQRKIALLESCLLFDSWSIEATYALAREMVIASCHAEELVYREGGPVQSLLMVARGEMRVHVAHELDALTTLPLDMARLPAGEIFGLVEAQRRLPVYRASLTATCASEVAYVPLETFRRAIAANARSAALVARLSSNRESWEAMRMECASKYRDAPPSSISVETTATARYLAEPPSLLSKSEARRYEMPFSRVARRAESDRRFWGTPSSSSKFSGRRQIEPVSRGFFGTGRFEGSL